MIQELKIKNYLSFKDEVVFSFDATKDKTFEDYQVVEVANDVRLLRFALVYGANASGKSNLLEAFEFLKTFFFAKPDSIDEKIGIIQFKLDKNTPNESSKFELKFYVKNIKYWYVLELDETNVHLEKMYYYTSVQPTLLFERRMEDNMSVIEFNTSAIKISGAAKDEISVKCLHNMSFFAARNQVNVSIPEIDAARDWIKSNFMPVVSPDTKLFHYAERYLQENPNTKQYLLDFLNKADFNISDIEMKMIDEKIPDNVMDLLLSSIEDEDIPNAEKERLQKEKTLSRIQTDFRHSVLNKGNKESYLLPSGLQSDGTQRVFGLEAVIYEMLQNKSFLAIDEIEKSLHPDIFEFVIQRFLQEKDNRSQLLITTHYDPLLNEVDDLFRKDSVWFTEKNEAGATELYSLTEFNGLNRISSLQKAYRNGRFGAIPNIKN